MVAYQPGILKATSFDNGRPTGSAELITVGKPYRLRLTADRATIHASRNDLSYVAVEVVDEKGQIIPSAAVSVSFQVAGVGEVVGVGNANPTDLSSFQQAQKTTFQGRCLAIVRPNGSSGTITLNATAPGLESAKLVITTNADLP